MRILPQACVVAVLMPIAGRLYDKVGPRPLAVLGFTASGYGNYLLHNLTYAAAWGRRRIARCTHANTTRTVRPAPTNGSRGRRHPRDVRTEKRQSDR